MVLEDLDVEEAVAQEAHELRALPERLPSPLERAGNSPPKDLRQKKLMDRPAIVGNMINFEDLQPTELDQAVMLRQS